ncbi:hypothetical protein J8I26_09170 [Herbaspirillum sp. LeCh32-8]|nr:hypothetical protein [Herbaspirillum sp. LeCh32-8]MBP0598272.1 hypothetical protein [Herbaspirillum sp. LeCh32-8]
MLTIKKTRKQNRQKRRPNPTTPKRKTPLKHQRRPHQTNNSNNNQRVTGL